MTRTPVPADPLAPLVEEIRRRLRPELDAELAALKETLLAEFRVERQLLTVHEAAKYLRMSSTTFSALARDGVVPAVEVNGRRRFYVPDLDEWAASRRIEGATSR